MTGRRVLGRGSRRRLDELVRRAYTAEPQPTVHHPRRYALAPRAAIAAGCVLIALSLVLAAHAALRAPAVPPSAGAGLAATPRGTASPSGRDEAGPSDRLPSGSPGPDLPKTPAGQVTVHVTGAVSHPSVQHLPAGSRVADAVAAAGGASPEADTQALNLARVLNDGEQVRVPRLGEPPPPADQQGTGGSQTGNGTGTGGTRDSGGPAGKVNVNTADASTLETLPGIGPALAKRIIAYRSEHGPFATVDDLTDVHGIGPAILEGLRQEATT